jgi:hypothetical protein
MLLPLLALLATAIVATTGNIYNGPWYQIGVAAITLVIGASMLRDTKDVDISVGSGSSRVSSRPNCLIPWCRRSDQLDACPLSRRSCGYDDRFRAAIVIYLTFRLARVCNYKKAAENDLLERRRRRKSAALSQFRLPSLRSKLQVEQWSNLCWPGAR